MTESTTLEGLLMQCSSSNSWTPWSDDERVLWLSQYEGVSCLWASEPQHAVQDGGLWTTTLVQCRDCIYGGESIRVHSSSPCFSFLFTYLYWMRIGFLADRTNGRAYATVLRLSSSVRSVLWLNGASWSKSYYWQTIGSRIWEIHWCQNEWPWPLVMSTIASASHSPVNISETGLIPKDNR